MTDQNEKNSPEQMRILYVEPHRPPRERMVENSLASLQSLVGGYMEHVGLENGVGLFCNDEGKLIGLEPNRALNGDIVVGPFVIVGENDKGDNISLSDEQVAKYTERFAADEHFTVEQVNDSFQVSFISF